MEKDAENAECNTYLTAFMLLHVKINDPMKFTLKLRHGCTFTNTQVP